MATIRRTHPIADMTRDDLAGRLRLLGIKPFHFATMTGISPVTVYSWGVRRGIPSWVELLLTAWERNRDLETRLKQLDA